VWGRVRQFARLKADLTARGDVLSPAITTIRMLHLETLASIRTVAEAAGFVVESLEYGRHPGYPEVAVSSSDPEHAHHGREVVQLLARRPAAVA
jgi:hypothetical protein